MQKQMTPEELGKLVEKALELKFEKDFEVQLSKHYVEEEIVFDDGHERHVKFLVPGANHGYIEVGHNGNRGGDAGHGGYTSLTFSFDNGMKATVLKGDRNYDMPYFDEWENAEIEIKVQGDDERRVLIQMLKSAISELEKNETLDGK